MLAVLCAPALSHVAMGRDLRGDVGDVDTLSEQDAKDVGVQKRIVQLRSKLKRVSDMIKERKAQEAGLVGEQGSPQSTIDDETQKAEDMAASMEMSPPREAPTAHAEEARSDASASIETSIENPPQHVMGSTTEDLPSDRPLNLHAETNPSTTEQRLLSSESEIHQMQHEMDSALHLKNRFTRAKGAARLEKAQPSTSDDVVYSALPRILGAGSELEYPGISFSSQNSNAAENGDEWEASDQATRSMDGNPLGVQDLQSQMDQILSSPLP